MLRNCHLWKPYSRYLLCLFGIYAYLVYTMSISLGIFLMLSAQAGGAAQVPFIIGKLLSIFEDEFVFLASVKFLPV